MRMLSLHHREQMKLPVIESFALRRTPWRDEEIGV